MWTSIPSVRRSAATLGFGVKPLRGSSNIAKFKRIPVPHKHLPPQASMLRKF
jgi:hypothetical protein